MEALGAGPYYSGVDRSGWADFALDTCGVIQGPPSRDRSQIGGMAIWTE